MGIVVEAPGLAQRGIQGVLPGVAEGRMTKIVSETKSFREIFVETKCARHRPANLGHFETVSKAHPVVIPVRSDEDLRFVTQSPKGHRVDQPVAIALKDVARATWTRIVFRMEPAPRRWRMGRKDRE
jgi:hypothetical protein